MTAPTTELVPCPAESPSAAKRPLSTRCRKHALARLSSNVGADTRTHGYSPRLWPTPYGPHRLAVNFVIGRYYDPQTGQFLSVDPQLQQTHQAYLYAAMIRLTALTQKVLAAQEITGMRNAVIQISWAITFGGSVNGTIRPVLSDTA
jgi:hypothetical protein